MKLQCLACVAAFLLGVSSVVCPPVPVRVSIGEPSPFCLVLCPLVVAAPAVQLCFLPRCNYVRLLLFCTCPPLCAWALWLMPAWVWRDVEYVFFPRKPMLPFPVYPVNPPSQVMLCPPYAALSHSMSQTSDVGCLTHDADVRVRVLSEEQIPEATIRYQVRCTQRFMPLTHEPKHAPI